MKLCKLKSQSVNRMFIYIFSNIEIYWAGEDGNKQCNRESHADIFANQIFITFTFF